MPTEFIDLPAGVPGTRQSLVVHRFGKAGSRPLVYVQGALHADEIPGMAAARLLADRLQALDERGLVRGEVVVVPVANPIGLGQRLLRGSCERSHGGAARAAPERNLGHPAVLGAH